MGSGPVSGSLLTAWSQIGILSLLSALPLTHARTLSLKINIKKKHLSSLSWASLHLPKEDNYKADLKQCGYVFKNFFPLVNYLVKIVLCFCHPSSIPIIYMEYFPVFMSVLCYFFFCKLSMFIELCCVSLCYVWLILVWMPYCLFFRLYSPSKNLEAKHEYILP